MVNDKALIQKGQTHRGIFMKEVIKANPKGQFGRSANSIMCNKDDYGIVQLVNGQVIVSNPEGFGKFPTISPCQNVTILINGETIRDTVTVNEDDRIVVQAENTEPSFKLALKITKDKMRAVLRIEKKPGKRFIIEDSPSASELCISAKFQREVWPEITLQQVLKKLRENNVIFGIREDAIQEAIQAKKSKMTIVAAVGQEPSGVKDSYIEYPFLKQTSNQNKVTDHGKILSVSVGEVLAIKRPPEAGFPGINVFGESVPPRQPKDEPILIKSGVRLINDGTVAVATISGKPVLEGSVRKYLSVSPVYVVDGDVGITTGNIRFKGSVVVTGSVLDNFGVDAGGSIRVLGDAILATLYANREVTINGKAISTRIQAGGLSVNYKQFLQILYELQNRIESLLSAVRVIKSQPAFTTADLQAKGEGRLVQLLIDYKYKDIPKLIAALEQVVSGANKMLDPVIFDVTDELKKKLCNLGPLRIRDQAEIELLIADVQKAVDTVKWLISSKVNVSLNYAQNSSIRTSGDIIITGMGSIISELEAGGSILIPNGKVRGSRLIAREKIKVYELGSPNSDVGINIQLLDHCSLEAKFVHPVVTLEHGTERLLIQEKYRNLRVWVNENGHLRFEGTAWN